MGYVIAAIVVLLLVAGFITFFVMNATRRSGGAGPQDPGAEGTPAGIAAPDESPLGDTTQHAGEPEGSQTGDSEASETAPHSERPRVGDPGAEAKAPDAAPESERLANRPR
jgi:hypothetical protein